MHRLEVHSSLGEKQKRSAASDLWISSNMLTVWRRQSKYRDGEEAAEECDEEIGMHGLYNGGGGRGEMAKVSGEQRRTARTDS